MAKKRINMGNKLYIMFQYVYIGATHSVHGYSWIDNNSANNCNRTTNYTTTCECRAGRNRESRRATIESAST